MPETWQLARALWGFGLGTALFVMVYLIFWNGRWRPPAGDIAPPEMDPTPKSAGPVTDFPEGLQEASGGVTSFLKVFMIVYAIWVVGYVVVFVLWSSGSVILQPITAAPYSTATERTLPEFTGR